MKTLTLAVVVTVGLLTAVTTANGGYRDGRTAYKAKDYSTAAREFREAADRGHARAQYWLGFLYEKGRGVEQNKETARRWYKLAAEQDDPRAQHRLGRLLRRGDGGPQDLVEAFKWYTLSLDQRPNDDTAYWLGRAERDMTFDQIGEAKRRIDEWRNKNR